MDNEQHEFSLKAKEKIIVYEISSDESSDENHEPKYNQVQPSKPLMRFARKDLWDAACHEEKSNNGAMKTAHVSTDGSGNQKSQTSLFGWLTPKNELVVKHTNRDKKIPQASCSWSDTDDSIELDELSPLGKKPKLDNKLEVEITDDESDTVPQVQIHHKIKVEGINVEMPVKPYECQQQVIESIIKGCNTEQNCLLESPTGSGKTLALLCGTLAWQMNYKKQFFVDGVWKTEPESPESLDIPPEQPKQCNVIDELSLDDIDPSEWDSCDMKAFESKPAKKKMPKIYYGSRTHRQIEQVVDELKKTIYRDTKMTLLSSREQSCIQHTQRNKTELCNELHDAKMKRGCPYYNEQKKTLLGSFNGLKLHGVESPWQIEDLVNTGRESGLCAYYAAMALVQEAEIVFCPYNYIIDPKIRESLSLDLGNSVIILDEAHNIEDISREAGSVSVPISMLESIITDCQTVITSATAAKKYHATACISVVSDYCGRLNNLIKSATLAAKSGSYDAPSSEQWTANELLVKFEMNNINASVTAKFMVAVKDVITQFKTSKEIARYNSTQGPTFTVNADSVRKLEEIVMGLQMIQSPAHAPDYRIVIKMAYTGPFNSRSKKERSLEFMCMNPAVIFRPLCALARSVILASGTLAPTTSFAGELGVEFPFTLQANHVTPPEQVFIKCVSKGSNGYPLKATYGNVNNWDFQEALGDTLLTVCNSVPHGILVFFSSYSVMDTVMKRWADNNMYNKMAERKTIFRETRGSADLNNMMRSYRQCIKDTSNGPVDKIDGAMLLAVFRGKVAEGIDFSDNEARAVVTIGIPYSVLKDPAIDMKLRYNNLKQNKNLMNGHAWYDCQAFRALNQALGRAIRHQNDWGAIILVDARLMEMCYVKQLPAWVRSMWSQQANSQADLATSLKQFVARQKKREQDGK